MNKIEIKREYHKFHYVGMLRASKQLCFVVANAGLEKSPLRSPGTSRFSCWASNSLFQAIYCINQFYLRNKNMINKLQEFTGEEAHLKIQGSESLTPD